MRHLIRFNPVERLLTLCSIILLVQGCGSKQLVPGPDKQFTQSLRGAASGAGAGAIYGAQVSSVGGPAVAAGAGLGAVAGAISGLMLDTIEEQQIQLQADTHWERERARVLALLADHYKRRLELHPTRDIFPADWFFYGDEVRLREGVEPLVRELVYLNKTRVPWSRVAVVAYVKANGGQNDFARHLAERRSEEISNELIRAGIAQKRVETRAVITDAPVLIDPYDKPERYSHAIELIALDK